MSNLFDPRSDLELPFEPPVILVAAGPTQWLSIQNSTLFFGSPTTPYLSVDTAGNLHVASGSNFSLYAGDATGGNTPGLAFMRGGNYTSGGSSNNGAFLELFGADSGDGGGVTLRGGDCNIPGSFAGTIAVIAGKGGADDGVGGGKQGGSLQFTAGAGGGKTSVGAGDGGGISFNAGNGGTGGGNGGNLSLTAGNGSGGGLGGTLSLIAGGNITLNAGQLTSSIAGGSQWEICGPLTTLRFFGVGAAEQGAVRQAVTGSTGANAALQSLLVQLAKYGLITNSST